MKEIFILISFFILSSPLFCQEEKGVLYLRKIDGKWGWYTSGGEKNGVKYVGEIENGKPNGQGTETFANGNKYVGVYKEGKRNGQFTVTFSDGDKFVGEYKEGKRNGQFNVTYSNGDKFVGEYKEGKMNGQGK